MMTEKQPPERASKRRPKRFLSPSQKYEIYLQLVRQEVTIAEAAASQQVDRSTILRIRTVAKEGALAALAASKPGVAGSARDVELEQAKVEVARLSEGGGNRSIPRRGQRGPRRLGRVPRILVGG